MSILDDHGYDLVGWYIRRSLGGNQLIKWRYGCVVSLRRPITFKLQTLDKATTKLIWLALRNITAKWSRSTHDWKIAMNQLAILFEKRCVQRVN